MAALHIARREGRVGGRKTVLTPRRLEAARKLIASGMAAQEIAPTIGVSVATLYRHLFLPAELDGSAAVVTGGAAMMRCWTLSPA